MRKIIILGSLIALLPTMVFAQEKIEAPVWNVGYKWVFDREGSMAVIGCDAQWYSVKFSGEYSPKMLLELPYLKGQLSMLNICWKGISVKIIGASAKDSKFSFTLGKQWKDSYQVDEKSYVGGMVAVEYMETFRVLGAEEIEVRVGKFKAIKLEYKIEASVRGAIGWTPQVNPRLYTGTPRKLRTS